jgi:hypothetical protein
MKWLAFTGASVAMLIALGILAVDERDVVWEGRQVFCPYCRAELRPLALACNECRRTFDWVTHRETCRWCLPRADVEHLNAMFEELSIEEEPLPGALQAFPMAFFRAMDEGTCTFCGGVGSVLEGEAEVDCSICRGDKSCIGCGGDRVVILGDPGAHRSLLERREVRRAADERSRLTGQPLMRTVLTDGDVAALRGFAEAETLSDEQGRNLLTRSRAKLDRAYLAVREEFEKARRERTADDAEGS